MEVAGTKAEASTQRLTRRMALLEIQARQMDASFAKSQSTTGKLVSAMGLTEEAAAKLGHAFGALSAVAAVGFLGHKLVEETIAAQNAMAQLEASVAATGGAAGRTVAQMDELSLALQKQTTFSDEAVKGAEAILLTFNKINGANLDRATAAVTTWPRAWARISPRPRCRSGRRCRTPSKGCRRCSGWGFASPRRRSRRFKTSSIRATPRRRRGVILTELEHRYAGAAEAARNTLGGALKGLANDFGDLFEVSKGGTSGVVDAIHGLDSAVRTLGENMGDGGHGGGTRRRRLRRAHGGRARESRRCTSGRRECGRLGDHDPARGRLQRRRDGHRTAGIRGDGSSPPSRPKRPRSKG
jgi:hypothetical protein